MILHVYPIKDTDTHELEGTMCKCSPKVKFENENIIVIHNSFDGREAVEIANEILNPK